MLPERLHPRLVRCLVTPVDGMGRGSIGISVSQGEQRRTAAFLCDVRSGICDALGEVEPESPTAGGLLDELAEQAGSECARDVPELALGLLSGSLMICGDAVPAGGARVARHHARPGVSTLRVPGDDRRRRPVLDTGRGDGGSSPGLARRVPVLA